MSGSPFKTVVLPAILVSTATFTALTLPFTFQSQREPTRIELSPLFSGEIQPIFITENREMTIRYIGFSILTSVGAGMATVELIRKRQAAHELAEARLEASNLQPMLAPAEVQKETQLEPLKWSTLPPAEDISFNRETVPDPLEPLFSNGEQPNPTPLEEQNTEFADLWAEPETIPSNGSVAAITIPAFSDLASAELTIPATKTATALEAIAMVVPEWEYQICRIRVPHFQRRIFAILLNGEYYSLFRSRKTQEKAVAIATRLEQMGRTAVITETERGYAVWIWEPSAQLDMES